VRRVPTIPLSRFLTVRFPTMRPLLVKIRRQDKKYRY
jgi:hypothetical protein